MDLQKTLNGIQAKLDARSSELDAREIALNQAVADVEKQKADCIAAGQYIDIKRTELDRREQAIANVESDVNRKAELDQIQSSISLQQQSLQLKENDLATIKATLDQREVAVAQREKDVSDKEITYKQTVRDEFFAQVAKQLPQ